MATEQLGEIEEIDPAALPGETPKWACEAPIVDTSQTRTEATEQVPTQGGEEVAPTTPEKREQGIGNRIRGWVSRRLGTDTTATDGPASSEYAADYEETPAQNNLESIAERDPTNGPTTDQSDVRHIPTAVNGPSNEERNTMNENTEKHIPSEVIGPLPGKQRQREEDTQKHIPSAVIGPSPEQRGDRDHGPHETDPEQETDHDAGHLVEDIEEEDSDGVFPREDEPTDEQRDEQEPETDQEHEADRGLGMGL